MKKVIPAFILVSILLNILVFILFALNQNTPVPASWATAGGERDTFSDWMGLIAQTALFSIPAVIVGVLIINRYSRHPIGWLLISAGMWGLLDRVLAEWVVYGYYTNPGQPLVLAAGWVVNWSWGILMILMALLPMLFPSGRFLSKIHKAIGLSLAAFYFLVLLASAGIESTMTSAYGLPNPLFHNTSPQLYDFFFTIMVVMIPVLFLFALGTVFLRFRRSAGREREQIKWFLAGLTMLVIQLLAGFYLGSIISGLSIGDILVNTMSLWLVVGIGIALLRHNLYDIDVIIRRTIIYALLSVLLAIIYFGTVIVLQGIVATIGGERSPVVVVISTLLIAALFNPLRQRIQAFIDRRFYRQKYDAQQILAQFAQTARDEVDMDKLTAELIHTVQETMQPEQVALWVKRLNNEL